MEDRIFGTDGIRGIAGTGILSAASVASLAGIMGSILLEGKLIPGPGRVCVGRDTRPSGEMLLAALRDGFTTVGVHVVDVGILPTPAVAVLTASYDCALGVVLSASHNPAEYNGLKVLKANGEKIGDDLEDEIGRRYLIEDRPSAAADRGGVTPALDGADRYVSHLLATWPGGALHGMKIAVDCADGATGDVAPRVLQALGADVHLVRSDMNGNGINRGCGALHPENVQRFAREVGAEIGLSFDGDGDRLILVDDSGSIRDGDDVLAICTREFLRRGGAPLEKVVGTVMSNVGLERSLEEIGVELTRAPVGDRWVLAEMQRGGHPIGGEPSGHVIFLPVSKAGDGILTALQVLRAVRESQSSLSILSQVITKAPQLVHNVRVRERVPLEEMEEVEAAIRAAEDRLGQEGRVLVRYSGTEPLVRIMVEGPDTEAIREMAGSIAAAFPTAEGD